MEILNLIDVGSVKGIEPSCECFRHGKGDELIPAIGVVPSVTEE